MTDREKAIVMAHTGITMLTGEKFQIFHEYIEKILGRPIWTHELGDELVWNEIKEKSKDDFIEICKTEERPTGHWIAINNKSGKPVAYKCSECERNPKHAIISDFCPNCGVKME